MAMASALEVGGLLGLHAATRATLDAFAAWLAADGVLDPRPVYALAGLEADWQAADALLLAAERGDALERALAAAAVARCARRLVSCEWVARAGLPTPWPPALAPGLEEVAAHLGREALSPLPRLDGNARRAYESFRLLAASGLAPLLPAWQRQDRLLPDGVLRSLAERGALAYGAPPRPGAAEPIAQVTSIEALAQDCLAAAEWLVRSAVVTKVLSLGGTAQQQDQWLPTLTAGQRVVAAAPAGFEHGEAQVLDAVRTPAGWQLTGEIGWFPLAGRADALLVLARTDPDPRRGHLGLSLFLITKPPTHGSELGWQGPHGGTLSGRALRAAGGRGLRPFAIRFDGLVVGPESLLGGEAGLGQGFVWLAAGLSAARLLTAAAGIGLMQAAYEAAWQAQAERVPDPLTRQSLAAMAVTLAGSRQLAYRTAKHLAHGDADVPAALAKLHVCRSAGRLNAEALRLAGETAGPEDHPLSRLALDTQSLLATAGDETALALHVVAPALIRGALAFGRRERAGGEAR